LQTQKEIPKNLEEKFKQDNLLQNNGYLEEQLNQKQNELFQSKEMIFNLKKRINQLNEKKIDFFPFYEKKTEKNFKLERRSSQPLYISNNPLDQVLC